MSGGGAAASVAVVLALLVGCSNEDPPASLPSAAPTTTTEATPTTTTSAPTTPATSGAPTVPAAAQEQTPDGAAAFVQHWYDTLNYAYATMDTAPFLDASADTCRTCTALAQTIDSVAERGNLIDGGQVSVRNLTSSAVLSDDSTTVSALFGAAELKEVMRDGSLVTVIEADGGDISYLLNLLWSSGTWAVTSARLLG